MKKRDVEKQLHRYGWWLYRHGRGHDIWTNGELKTSIPRHREIKENTARGIKLLWKTLPRRIQMEIEAKLRKTPKKNEPDWLVTIDALRSNTQGYTRNEAIKMAKYLVLDLLEAYFEEKETKNVKVEVCDFGRSRIGLHCSDPNLLVSLILIRQREAAKISVRDVAKRLGSPYPNSYSVYERGKRLPSLAKFDELLHAIDPKLHLRMRVL